MKKITINGKEYPFRLTVGAMVAYKHDTGEDFSQFKGDDMEKLGTIIYHGVRSACKADGIVLPCDTKEDLLDYIDMQEAAVLLASDKEDSVGELDGTSPLPS